MDSRLNELDALENPFNAPSEDADEEEGGEIGETRATAEPEPYRIDAEELTAFLRDVVGDGDGLVELRPIASGRGGAKSLLYHNVEDAVRDLVDIDAAALRAHDWYFGVGRRAPYVEEGGRLALADLDRNGCVVHVDGRPKTCTSGADAHVRTLTVAWCDLDLKEMHGVADVAAIDDAARRRSLAKMLEAVQAQRCPPSRVNCTGNGLHCYWLLTESVEAARVRRLNGAIAKALKAVGGDAHVVNPGRILRLPGTLNVKRPERPRACYAIEGLDGRRHAIADLEAAFAVREETETTTARVAGADPGAAALPPCVRRLVERGAEPGEREAVAKELAAALVWLERADLDPGTATAAWEGFLRASERDEGNDPWDHEGILENYREHAARYVRRTKPCLRGRAKAIAGEDCAGCAHERAQIVEHLGRRTQGVVRAGDVVLRNLTAACDVLRDEVSGETFLLDRERHTLAVVPREKRGGSSYQRLVSARGGLPRGLAPEAHRYVAGELLDREARPVRVRLGVHGAAGAFYVSCAEGEVLRCAGGVERVPNGTEGVLLLPGGIASFDYVPRERREKGLFERLMVDRLRFGGEVDAGVQRALWRAWLLLLMLHPTTREHPIAVMTGAPGQGKTSALELVAQVLLGQNAKEADVRDERSFCALIHRKYISVLDDVNRSRDWFESVLSAMTTGAGRTERVLFTDGVGEDDVVRFLARGWVSIASNSPRFNNPQVARRSLPFQLEPPERKDPFFVDRAAGRRGEVLSDWIDWAVARRPAFAQALAGGDSVDGMPTLAAAVVAVAEDGAAAVLEALRGRRQAFQLEDRPEVELLQAVVDGIREGRVRRDARGHITTCEQASGGTIHVGDPLRGADLWRLVFHESNGQPLWRNERSLTTWLGVHAEALEALGLEARRDGHTKARTWCVRAA